MITIKRGCVGITAKDVRTAWEMAETWDGRRPDYEMDLKRKGWEFVPTSGGSSQ